ncbi:glycosyltransferase family 39 protein [bacterium]|nr:glycosyltransferase family 39 protein [bacterium]
MVLLLAALLRFFPLGFSNPRFFHVDEWDFVESAVHMWAEGTLDPGPPYVHPGLYRYAIAAVYPVVPHMVGGSVGPGMLSWLPYITGRLVSAAMGALSVWLVYRLARQLMPWGAAVAAALVLAVTPLHVQFSHIAKPDVMATAWVALATLLAWRLAEAPRRSLYVWAGIAVGLAVASKYNGIVAAAPVLVAHLAAPGRDRLLKRLFAPALWLSALCSVLTFAVVSPYTLIMLARGVNSVDQGFRILVARPPDPEALPQAAALVRAVPQAFEWIGPAPLALAAVGAFFWWRDRRKALLVVGSVIVATMALVSIYAVMQPFYLLPLVPALAVLCAGSFAELGKRIPRAGRVLIGVCLLPSLLLSVREVVRFRVPSTRQVAESWLARGLRDVQGNILCDGNCLETVAAEHLPIIDGGSDFYDKVDREYLRRQSISHFVLSDTAASTSGLKPGPAQRRVAAHDALTSMGELLVRFAPSWWRGGPSLSVYKVRPDVLAEFEREREQAVADLRSKVAAIEERLSAEPESAALHLEAGRLLCSLAGMSRGNGVMAAWKRAEEVFRQAHVIDPKLGDAPYDLGCLYLRVAAWTTRGRGAEAASTVFARAADAFRTAVALDPEQADYHFNLGFALWSSVTRDEDAWQRSMEEGTRAYRRAAELDPGIQIPDPHVLAVAERGPQPLR